LYPGFAAFLIAGPVCLLAFLKDYDKSKTWLETHPKTFLFLHTWPLVPIYFMRIFKDMVEKYENNEIVSTKRAMRLLFDCVDNIVGNKSERFSKYAVENPTPACCVFASITNPLDQMQKLIYELYTFFGYYKGDMDVEIRVAFVKMGERHIEEFVDFQPRSKPPGLIENYQNDNCAFSKALQLQDILIIESIGKELKRNKKKRRFASVQGDPKKGSMIVYPVKHRGLQKVVYCISVFASEAFFFKTENKDFYIDVLDKFTKRIELEHSLKIIKDNVLANREVENECVAN